MKDDFPKISLMGERAILIEFEPEINDDLLGKLLFLKVIIENIYIEVEVEVINTYNSLLINYPSTIEDPYNEVVGLKKLFENANIDKKSGGYIYHVPVCYDEEFGLDLDVISEQNGLSKNEIISFHSSPMYTVYFIGFLPGFLYLGGLDKRLHISRKNEPRLEVKKGAVGIGEKQTGIYPQTSPGGWQIIGNSPIEFFDKNKVPPCEISAGDRLKFYAVSKEEFYRISEEVKAGNFKLKKEVYES